MVAGGALKEGRDRQGGRKIGGKKETAEKLMEDCTGQKSGGAKSAKQEELAEIT